jgi:hypothetical protein
MYATIAALIGRPVSDDDDVAEDGFNVLPSLLGEATQEPIRSSGYGSAGVLRDGK